MKDSYSFDIDYEGFDAQFDRHAAAYNRIFERIDLDTLPVQASSGTMGGKEWLSTWWRPTPVKTTSPCARCLRLRRQCRASNLAARRRRRHALGRRAERFATPGIRTIAALADGFEFAAADRQIKTLVYVADGSLLLVLIRGDHELMEQKLVDGMGTEHVRPAHPDEIRAAARPRPREPRSGRRHRYADRRRRRVGRSEQHGHRRHRTKGIFVASTFAGHTRLRVAGPLSRERRRHARVRAALQCGG